MTLLVFAGQDCSLIDACATNPCANGARCTNWNNHYNCSCPPGYQGKNCRNDIDECRKPGKCLNGGICMNTPGSFRCECLAGYSGRTCEVPTQPCAPSQCLNGGTCHQTGDHTYECACLPGTNRQKTCRHSCRHTLYHIPILILIPRVRGFPKHLDFPGSDTSYFAINSSE